MQCPSVHITNMNTGALDDDKVRDMKKEVSDSTAKMIKIAEDVVTKNPSVEKVVLVDCVPRFDSESCDPSGLKPKLARYSNELSREFVSKSELKDKIVVGKHSMDCNRETYGDEKSPLFDGVHMSGSRGSESYTKSLASILRNITRVDPWYSIQQR